MRAVDRDKLVELIGTLLEPVDAANLLKDLGHDVWGDEVPLGAPYRAALRAIVDAADEQLWLADLVKALIAKFPARHELVELQAVIDRRDSGLQPAVVASGSGLEAAMRSELAGALGKLIGEHAEIVQVVETVAPKLDVAGLPSASARAAWTYVIVELVNRGDTAGFAALLAEGKKRSARVDWARYASLVSGASATGSAWVHLALDARWPRSDGERSIVSRVERATVVVDAVVTLQWSGPRPPDPDIASRTSSIIPGLFAGDVPHPRLEPMDGNVAGVAGWSARFPVAPPRLLTRRIEVAATAGAERSRSVCYLHSVVGYALTTTLWALTGAFILWWLWPLGGWIALGGLGIWAIAAAASYVVPHVREYAGTLGWVTRAWETTLPICGVLVALAVALPPRLFVVAYNDSPVSVMLSSELPKGLRRTYWQPQSYQTLDRQICECPADAGCPCVESDVRFVHHIEFHCKLGGSGDRCDDVAWRPVSEWAPDSYATGDVGLGGTWESGKKLLFSKKSLTGLEHITSGDASFTFKKLAATGDGVNLPVLVGSALQATYADGDLACDNAVGSRVDVLEATPLPFTLSTGPSATWRPRRAGPVTQPDPIGVARVCVGKGPARLQVEGVRAGFTMRLSQLGIQDIELDGARVRCTGTRPLRVVAAPSLTLPRTFGRLAHDEALAVTCEPDGPVEVPGHTCKLDARALTCTAIPVHRPGPCTYHMKTKRVTEGTSPNCMRAPVGSAVYKLALEATPRTMQCATYVACEQD